MKLTPWPISLKCARNSINLISLLSILYTLNINEGNPGLNELNVSFAIHFNGAKTSPVMKKHNKRSKITGQLFNIHFHPHSVLSSCLLHCTLWNPWTNILFYIYSPNGSRLFLQTFSNVAPRLKFHVPNFNLICKSLAKLLSHGSDPLVQL